MEDKWTSRKYQAAWKLTWLTTILLAGPWIANVLFGLSLVMIIDANIWAMVLISVWGVYFAANVTEKHGSFIPNSQRKHVVNDQEDNG